MPATSSVSPKRFVSVFGYYKYGNFGDDLMAVIFGEALKSRGIPFRVYQLNSDVLAEFQFEGADNMDELLSDAAAVVYGGGGAFLATRVKDFEAAILRLCEVTNIKRIPIYMFSVGGDGTPFHEIADARQGLFHRASFITFRNREDVTLLQHSRADNKGEIHDDVVWQTSTLFPVNKTANRKFTIGIDSSLLGRRWSRLVIWSLKRLSQLMRKDYRFVTIIQSRQSTFPVDQSNVIRYSKGIRQFIHELSQMDVIITHRIHLGIVAMSCDVPVIQLRPLSKAKMLFNRLGLNQLVFESKASIARFLLLMLNEDAVRNLKPKKLIADFDRVLKESGKHIEALFHLVEPIVQNDGSADKNCQAGSNY